MTPRQYLILVVVSVAVAGLGVLVVLSNAIPIAYHTYRMKRVHKEIYAEPQTSLDGWTAYGSGDQWECYEYHRGQLVALGRIIKRQYELQNVLTGTAECDHLITEMLVGRCPTHIDLTAPDRSLSKPMEIIVWCDPEHETAWDEFVARHNIANYRDVFMRNSASGR
jgi:hypothetical protein